MLGVSKMTSGAVARGELGWWRMEARRDLARLRFWGKLVGMEEGRIVKKVYRERRKRFEEGKWVDTKNWCTGHDRFWWRGLEAVWAGEVVDRKGWGTIIKSALAAREQKEWAREVAAKPKLRTYQKLKSKFCYELYLNCGDSWTRSLMTMMRGGTNMLRIERGRWNKEKVEERVCRVCTTNQVENEQHFLLECKVYESVRQRMYKEIAQVTDDKYDMHMMKDNKEWMMDALIGHGLPDKTTEIIEIVLKCLNTLVKVRERYTNE